MNTTAVDFDKIRLVENQMALDKVICFPQGKQQLD